MSWDYPRFGVKSRQKMPTTGTAIHRVVEITPLEGGEIIIRLYQEDKAGSPIDDMTYRLGEDEVKWILYGLASVMNKQ